MGWDPEVGKPVGDGGSLRFTDSCTDIGRTLADTDNPFQRKTMSTAKKEVKKLLDQLPDKVSYEDIQYHIYVYQKIEHGLKDVEEGRTLSQKEVERRMMKWLGR